MSGQGGQVSISGVHCMGGYGAPHFRRTEPSETEVNNVGVTLDRVRSVVIGGLTA